MTMAANLFEAGTEPHAKNLKFVEEEIRIQAEFRPKLATRPRNKSSPVERALRGRDYLKSLRGFKLARG